MLESTRSQNLSYNVCRNLQFSLASTLANCTSFCSFEKAEVCVDLFCSKNLRTFLIFSELSWSQIEFKLSALFFQKLTSVSGSG